MRTRLLIWAWLLGLYTPPDRAVLLKTILPWYRDRSEIRTVLFVGVRIYTRRYGRDYEPGRFRTLDMAPSSRWFGSRDHIVDRVENVNAHFAPGSVDVVVLNGVIGWGLDDPEAVNRTLVAIHGALRPGGHLVVGVNEGMPSTPDLDSLTELERYSPLTFPPLGTDRLTVETPFSHGSHTFLFFSKAA